MRTGSALVLAGAVSLGALAAGGRFNPGPQHPSTATWYAGLRKPAFTPPGPVFALAWPLLDALLWFTGYRLLRARRSPRRSTSIGLWLLTLLGIPGYSWTFFGRHRPGEALGASTSMLAGAAALAATAAEVDRTAAWATAPLVAWLVFANLLQEEVWRRNEV